MTVPKKLSIDTPEQINLEYELAGPGSRFMALFVDLMIQLLAMICLVIVLVIAGVAVNPFRGSRTWVLALFVLSAFFMHWGYFVLFEIFWKGQTPGKRQAGIRVMNERGREASAYEAIARNLLRAVDSLPGLYALGAVVMFLSPQYKRIGDYVAGTIVVHDRRPEEGSIFFNTGKGEVADAINYAALSPNEVELIETFLQRRVDLALEVRQRTAAKLATHLREKCAVPEGSCPDNEDLLEILVRGFRRGARFYSR
ncbi:MAG: RDD family protein [Candidatus Korobacteraceae bacterium]